MQEKKSEIVEASQALLSINSSVSSKAPDDDESSSDEEDVCPSVPPALRALKLFMRIETLLTRRLEAVFTILMDGIVNRPVILFFFGICAGGMLGVHIAAFSIGYVSMILFSTPYRMFCDMMLMCIGVHEAYDGSSPSVLPMFCLGKELSKFIMMRRMTPETAAALSIHTIGIISPTWNIIGLHCLILLKKFSDAFVTTRR
tara:strand:- start:1084 stop:1686 length:603 start_codon:yes stop_codon:yes gene_type:complete